MKYSKMDYVRRVSNATPVQLVVINYELTLEFIRDAKQNILDNDKDKFYKNISKAQDAMHELMSGLDMSHAISLELLSIYLFVNKLLAQAGASRKTEHLDNADSILSKLLNSWLEIEKNELDKAPLLENSHQVYAGLTYGRQGLNEYIMEDTGRGFKA